MSTYDLEQTTDVQRRPAVRHEGSGPDASTMIGLQRLAGNSAVASAIQSGQISDGGPINLQRIDDEDDEYEDEEAGGDEAGSYDIEEDYEDESEDEEDFSIS